MNTKREAEKHDAEVRSDTLRVAAIMVAQSRQTTTADAYAVARELWALWWREKEARSS